MQEERYLTGRRRHLCSEKNFINWELLDQKRHGTEIDDVAHRNITLSHSVNRLRRARKEWKNIKKVAADIRNQFLMERADEVALKMNTSCEKALKAIKRAEQSKQTYQMIHNITGHKKDKKPLTQVDILDGVTSSPTTLTNKESIEQAIMELNIRHSRQSLKTPFAADEDLAKAVNPTHDGNKINNILNGTFLSEVDTEYE